MALDFGMLQPVNISGQLMAGQQQAQQNQLAQQQLLANKQQMETGALQQQKAQLELADYKTKQEGLDKFVQLSAANGKTGSPKELASSFYEFALAQRDPQLIMSAQTMLQAANERERYQGYLKSQQTIPAQQAPAPIAGLLGSGTFGMDNLPGMPNALAQRAAAPIESTNALATQAANPVAALETKIAQLRTFRDPDAQAEVARLQKQVDEYNKVHVVAPGASLVVGDKSLFTAPEKAVSEKLHVVGGNLVRDDGTVVFTAPKITGDGAGVPKAPSGYRVTATGDLEAIPGGPAAGKPMTDLQKQAYRKDFANDTANIKSASDTANELEKLTDELVGNPDKGIKAHPGLRGITGYAGLVPSLPTGNAAKAEQKLETFKGKIKALGRTIASQQGKLGNMAVQEWQMVSDAVQAIKPTAGNLDEQMRDVVRQAKQLSKNMQDKFDLTYEGDLPAAGKPPASAVPAAGTLSPAEQAELAALRKRFGK